MRYRHVTVVLLLLSTFCFSQFSKIVTDPILENPAYIGSDNKVRLSTDYSFQEITSKQTISYDIPIREKLGLGIRLAHNNLFDGREIDLTSGVSFHSENYRRRSCKDPDHFVVWSGGLSAKINYLYQPENYFFFTTKPGGFYAELNPENDVRNTNVFSEDVLTFVGLSTPRFIVGFHIGTSRRTNKSLQETSIYYDPIMRFFKHQLSTYFLLDDNKKNKLNATLGFSSELVLTGEKEIIEGYQNSLGYLSSRRVLPLKTALLGTSFWMNYSNLKLGVEFKKEFWSVYKEQFDAEFFAREVSDYTTENLSKFSLGYRFKFVTVMAHYTYGFADIDLGIRWDDPIDLPEGGTMTYAEKFPEDVKNHNFYKRLSLTATFMLEKNNKVTRLN